VIWKRGLPCMHQLSQYRLSAKASIQPIDEQQARTEPPLPSSWSLRNSLPLLSVQLTHDDRQNFFLFRLSQLLNHRSKLIEDLLPALQLTAIFRALHGFISDEGEFRLAVSQILKEGHVVRALYGLMLYS
jgi:hypothetical protein